MHLSAPIPSTAIVVAVCASLSFFACISLFGYFAWCFLAAELAARTKDADRKARAADRLRFPMSQFGALFINLMVADCIQAIGFGFANFRWAELGAVDLDSAWCTVQGVSIQVGDTASALWVLAIAAHTMAVLAMGRQPPRAVLIAVGVFIWALVILFAVIGPAALATKARGPYYTDVAAWCWIGNDYKNERVWLHYIWLFIAAGGDILLYGVAIFALRRRAQSALSKTLAAHTGGSPFWVRIRRALATSSSGSNGSSSLRDRQAISMNPQLVAEARVRTAARKMVFYPLVYLALVMPLTIVRFSEMTGHHPSISSQIAVGSIFTLSGFANALLCLFTRRLIGPHSSDSAVQSHASVPSTSAAGRKPYPSPAPIVECTVEMETRIDVLTPRMPEKMLELKGERPSLAPLAIPGRHGPRPMPAVPAPSAPSYDLRAAMSQSANRQQLDRHDRREPEHWV